jgi:chorismate mutase
MSNNSKNIDTLRIEIELLHEKLLHLIIVDSVWDVKQSQNLNLTDSQRENQLIHQFDSHIDLKNDENLKVFYQNVVKNIIAETKNYLTRKAQK